MLLVAGSFVGTVSIIQNGDKNQMFLSPFFLSPILLIYLFIAEYKLKRHWLLHPQ